MVNAANLKVGDLVKLKDKTTLASAYDKYGFFVGSAEAEVLAVTQYVEQNDNMRVSVAQLDYDNLYLLSVEASDGEYYTILAVIPDVFKPGNRQDMLDYDQSWIFQEPKYVDSFTLAELEFVNEIYNTNADKEIKYTPVHDTLYGRSSEDKMFALVHLASNEECDLTECLILEHGNLEEDTGGYIQMFHGSILNDGELEVL